MDGLTSQLESPPQCGGTGQAQAESQFQYLSWDLQAHKDKKDINFVEQSCVTV